MRFRRVSINIMVLFMVAIVVCGMTSHFEIKKKVIGKEQFIDLASNSGFQVEDSTYQYEQVSGLKSAIHAYNTDGSLVYEFYTFKDQDTADQEFDIFRKTLGDSFNAANDSSYSGENYLVYNMSDAQEYHHLCAVDNTLFYAKSPDENKDEVRDFAKVFGYN